MSEEKKIKRVIISRTDAIGDVILTLPICGLIKKHFPECVIIFLGRTYTKPIIDCCEHIDKFLNADELLKLPNIDSILKIKSFAADCIIHVFPNKHIAKLAKQAGIKIRIGTSHRAYHLTTVNKFVNFGRKNSDLHESQLNCKLLSPLGITDVPELKLLNTYSGFTKLPTSQKNIYSLLDRNKRNIILHPKSNASAREWSLNNYKELINLLPENEFKIFVCGTQNEKAILLEWLKTLPSSVVDLTDKFSLTEYISFISRADFLIAASTGPLHIASALGIGAIGIYPPMRPIHPGRWKPIGKKSNYFVIDKQCKACKTEPQNCVCINEIEPQQVASFIFTSVK